MTKLYHKIKQIFNKIYFKTPKDTNEYHFKKYLSMINHKVTLKNKSIHIFRKIKDMGEFQIQ